MAGRVNKKRAEAGQKFRDLRIENHWDLADVERETMNRFGDEFVVRVSQLSHIEKGDHGRVSLDDAITLGTLYGKTPEEVCGWYGIPVPQGVHTPKDKRPQAIIQAEEMIDELPPAWGNYLISDIQYAIMSTKQRYNEQMGVRRPHTTEPPAANVRR